MDRKEQLIKLVSGNMESGEKEKLLDEIRKDLQLRKAYEDIKNTWALSSSEQTMEDIQVENAYLSLKKKNEKRSVKALFFSGLKYAAVVVLVFSLGFFSRQIFPVRLSEDQPGLTTMNEVSVPNGQRAEIQLSDGTKVWLNSGTSIKFPKSFDTQRRLVRLSGEAFFEVKKGKVPFIVSSGYGDIHVLGTKFNVRAYSDLNFQTTLLEGKIHFSNPDGEKMLAPGQQLIMASDRSLIVKQVDPRLAASWKDGVISFENEKLDDVTKKLERHFDIRILLDPKIASIRFTGQIFNESVTEVMEYMNKTKPIRYAYDKKMRILKIRSKE